MQPVRPKSPGDIHQMPLPPSPRSGSDAGAIEGPSALESEQVPVAGFRRVSSHDNLCSMSDTDEFVDSANEPRLDESDLKELKNLAAAASSRRKHTDGRGDLEERISAHHVIKARDFEDLRNPRELYESTTADKIRFLQENFIDEHSKYSDVLRSLANRKGAFGYQEIYHFNHAILMCINQQRVENSKAVTDFSGQTPLLKMQELLGWNLLFLEKRLRQLKDDLGPQIGIFRQILNEFARIDNKANPCSKINPSELGPIMERVRQLKEKITEIHNKVKEQILSCSPLGEICADIERRNSQELTSADIERCKFQELTLLLENQLRQLKDNLGPQMRIFREITNEFAKINNNGNRRFGIDPLRLEPIIEGVCQLNEEITGVHNEVKEEIVSFSPLAEIGADSERRNFQELTLMDFEGKMTVKIPSDCVFDEGIKNECLLHKKLYDSYADFILPSNRFYCAKFLTAIHRFIAYAESANRLSFRFE